MIELSYSEEVRGGIVIAVASVCLSIVLLVIGRYLGFRVGSKRFVAIDSILSPTQDGHRWPMRWHPVFLLVALFGVFVAILLSVPSIITVRQFRSLELVSVSGLTVFRLDSDEDSVADAVPREPAKQFKDVSATETAMRLLAECKPVSHQHDTLYDGYLLNINEAGVQTNLALRVYKKSTLKGSRQVVIPQYGGLRAGEFDCPELLRWVNENIDPIFTPQTAP